MQQKLKNAEPKCGHILVFILHLFQSMFYIISILILFKLPFLGLTGCVERQCQHTEHLNYKSLIQH